MIITIDGPAASGKTTVAKEVAKQLGYLHLNSGALYRAVAAAALRRGISFDDESGMTQIAAELRFEFRLKGDGSTALFVNGEESGGELLQERVGAGASKIAVLAGVREILTRCQREAGAEGRVVLEGRDAGTVVFPDTPFKFYIDAPLVVRAKRRLEDEVARSGAEGEEERLAILERLTAEIQQRDSRDSRREIAPQMCPKDAIRVETGELSVAQVVDTILQRCKG